MLKRDVVNTGSELEEIQSNTNDKFVTLYSCLIQS